MKGSNHRIKTDFSTSLSNSSTAATENKIFVNGLSTFCQQTSLHGWQYMDSENGLWRKIAWFLVILGFSAAAISKI